MPPIHMHSLLMLLNTQPTLERSWSPTLLILVSQTEKVDITSLSLSNALFLAWMEMELKSPLKQPLRPKMISPVVPQMFTSKICGQIATWVMKSTLTTKLVWELLEMKLSSTESMPGIPLSLPKIQTSGPHQLYKKRRRETNIIPDPPRPYLGFFV